MNINRKLDEIRQQPEHIRIRYVWFMVIVSMFLVILIWIFSFKTAVKSTSSDKAILPDFKNSLESQKQEMPSIQDFMDKNSTTGGSEGSLLEDNNAESINSSEGNINNSNVSQ